MGSIPGSGRSPGGGMATHSSILAWRIPRTEEPGGLQSTGLWSWIQLRNRMHAGSTLLKGFEPRPWNVYRGPEGVRGPQLCLTWKLVYISQAPGGIWFSSLQWDKELATPTSVLLLRFPSPLLDHSGQAREWKRWEALSSRTPSHWQSQLPHPCTTLSTMWFPPLPPWVLGPGNHRTLVIRRLWLLCFHIAIIITYYSEGGMYEIDIFVDHREANMTKFMWCNWL